MLGLICIYPISPVSPYIPENRGVLGYNPTRPRPPEWVGSPVVSPPRSLLCLGIVAVVFSLGAQGVEAQHAQERTVSVSRTPDLPDRQDSEHSFLTNVLVGIAGGCGALALVLLISVCVWKCLPKHFRGKIRAFIAERCSRLPLNESVLVRTSQKKVSFMPTVAVAPDFADDSYALAIEDTDLDRVGGMSCAVNPFASAMMHVGERSPRSVVEV